MKISVVSPVYNAEEMLQDLVDEILASVDQIKHELEIILVNDNSPDNSWIKIEEICKEKEYVKGVNLSRNFGQHSAILAGITLVSGDVCIVMDCDLQDDPKYIPDLLKSYENGYDVVYTVKKERKHSIWKNFWAKGFNLVFNFLSNDEFVKGVGSVGAFSLISKKVVKSFVSFGDYQFHYLRVLNWMGFRSAFVQIDHRERGSGKSSYNIKRMFNHAMIALLYYSDKILKINIISGFVLSILSFFYGLYILFTSIIFGYQAGWPSLIVVILFSTGIILTSIGVVGLYISKIFEQVKGRPKFIISNMINF